MSKCRYDLSEDCNNKDCVRCVLDKIRAEIGRAWCTKPKNRYEEGLKDQALKDLKIIDKYKAESDE